MSSINLLPKNFNFESEESRGIEIAPLVSFLLIIFPLLSFIFLYFSNQNSLKEVSSLSIEISAINKKIEREISNNEFLSVEVKGSKVDFLLSRHIYFTEAIYFLQENLMDRVFIKNMGVSFAGGKYVDINIDGVARDYSSIATQMYILKSLPAVEDFSIKNIEKNEWGNLDFDGNLKLDKKIIVYDEKL